MSLTQPVCLVVGALMVAATLYDLFHSVLMPRPSVTQVEFAPFFTRHVWRLWRFLAPPTMSVRRREARLAAFGPVMLISLLAIWVAALILGYGLILSGLGQQVSGPGGFGTALFVSAQGFLTLGFGVVGPVGTLARLAVTLEAASGLGVVAMVVSLLFALFQAFQRREVLVVDLDATAGAPPSGLQILESCAAPGMGEHLGRVFGDWRRWAAEVLESHLAYPVLIYFRSSHDNEAWLNSFGAVMDAAALLVTCQPDDLRAGEARLLLTVGRHLTDDFAAFFRLDRNGPPGLERLEFDEARARMAAAGYQVQADDEAAWRALSDLRSRYVAPINQLAKYLVLPPAQWLGDRSYLPHRKPPAV